MVIIALIKLTMGEKGVCIYLYFVSMHATVFICKSCFSTQQEQ